MRAIAIRYDGVSFNRVSVNYDHFVTAFSYDIDLFLERSSLPRLTHLSHSEVAAIQNELTTLIMAHDATESSWNWQATTDMVVTRYSSELSYFVSGKITAVKHIHTEIERVLSPFIDYRDRDLLLEADRCATQFLPLKFQTTQTLASNVVHIVTHNICSTLLEAWSEPKLESAVQKIQDLVEYLDWTTWKKCRGCDYNEICVVPTWPMGTLEDYAHPRCKEFSKPDNRDGDSYWIGLHE